MRTCARVQQAASRWIDEHTKLGQRVGFGWLSQVNKKLRQLYVLRVREGWKERETYTGTSKQKEEEE